MPDSHARSATTSGRTDKRQDVLKAALATFAHDGYSRASIDAIAQRATVSTRTLYKHFGTKAALFTEVVRESTERVAASDLALLEEHLPPGVRPEALGTFARAWVGSERQSGEWPEHDALVRHIQADLDNIPEETITTWLETGPQKVLSALAARFRSWATEGVLDVADADRAAAQFAQLVMPGSAPGARADLVSERDAWIDDAVRLFLRGSAPVA